MSMEGRSKYDDATEVALSTESLPPELQAKIAAAREQARARAAGLEVAPPSAPPVPPSAPVERPAWMVDETIALGSGPGAVELPTEILALRRAAQTRTAMAIETPPMAPSPMPLRDETMLVQPSTAFVQPAGDWQPQPPSAPSSLDALLAAPPPGVHATNPTPPPSLAEPPPLPIPTPVPTADLFAHLAAPPPPPATNPIPPASNWTSPAPDRTFELSADAARPFAPFLPQSFVVPAAPTAPTPSPNQGDLQPAPPAPWTAPAATTPIQWQPPVPPAPTTRQQAPRSRSNPYGFDEPTTAFMAEHVEVRNKTEAVVVTRAHGVGALVVIKQRYFLSRRGELSPVPGASAQEADERFADPLGGSLRVPSDFGGPHAGTDVLILGDAIAPRGGASRVDVRVRVGAASRALAVFGLRTWHKGRFLGGLKLTDPTPFDRCPLRWELAFGGNGDQLNPVGVAREGAREGGSPPRIEDPSAPSSAESVRAMPVGVAPIAADWPTRAQYPAGDPRREQAAAPGLVVFGYLQGGEPFEISGMHEEGDLRGVLPRHGMLVQTRTSDREAEGRASLDSVLVLPNERAFVLTWRCFLPSAEDLRTVRVVEVT